MFTLKAHAPQLFQWTKFQHQTRIVNKIVQFRGEGLWENSLERGEKFTNLKSEERNSAFPDAGSEDYVTYFSALEINSVCHLLEYNGQ